MALAAVVLAQGVMGGLGAAEEVVVGNQITLTVSRPRSGRTKSCLSLLLPPVVVVVAVVVAVVGEDLTTIRLIPGIPTI